MNKHYRVCARAIFYLCQTAGGLDGIIPPPKRELAALEKALARDDVYLSAEDVINIAFVSTRSAEEIKLCKRKYPNAVQFMMTLPF
jgi:hypothetical protein